MPSRARRTHRPSPELAARRRQRERARARLAGTRPEAGGVAHRLRRPSRPARTGARLVELPAPAAGAESRQHAWRGFVRPRLTQVVVAALIMLMAAGSVWLVRARADDATYSNARRSDLVELLDQLTTEQRRLEGEISQLENTRSELQNGADKQRVAEEEAAKRLAKASVLAGTTPVSGPGITVTILDPQQKITPEMLVDALAELRDAGAEAIEVNQQVRVVASTYVGGAPGAITFSGQPVDQPVTLRAIGDPRTLEEGLRFRGGMVSQVQSRGGSVSITQTPRVDIASVVAPAEPKFAKPR